MPEEIRNRMNPQTLPGTRSIADSNYERNGSAFGASPAAAILAGAPDAVVVVNDRGSITWANRRFESMLGAAAGALCNRPLSPLLGNASEFETLVSATAAETAAGYPVVHLRQEDGTLIQVTASASRLERGDGGGPATVIFLRHAIDPRRTAGALERANRELEHCVHSLAHDLRSPLVALLGFSRLLRQDYGDEIDDTGRHFIDRIEQAGRTMEELIHDLLELSRIGQGGERRAMNDPRAVLLQIGAELKPRLDTAATRLEIPEHPPLVYCDRTRLYQVFSNLIGNALDHMGACEDPVITVSVWDDEAGHQIAVRDRGRGIAPGDRERIFEVFQSLGPADDGRRGSGIGLAIVHKIAEMHGGRVWVESDPGDGATFRLTFPRR